MKTIALVMCLFMLSGCASLRDRISTMNEKGKGYSSFVSPEISKSDADEVAKDISQFLMSQFAAAKTTLEFEPLKNPLHVQLLDQLARKGFGLVESRPKIEPQGIPVRYYVTPLDRGLLVRLQYQGKQASRFYDRTVDGRLTMNSSYTVREARK